MRVLTVPEFYEWSIKTRPTYYIVSTENNPHTKALGFYVGMRFMSMLHSSSLNRICLQNDSGVICLEQVKEVHMYDDVESVGVVFDVVCETGCGKYIWRLIAD